METQEIVTIDLTRFELEVILTSLKLRKYVFDDIDRGRDFNDTESNLIDIFQEDFKIITTGP